VACQQDTDVLSSNDVQNVNSFSTSSAHFSESSEISTNVVKGLTLAQYSGARISSGYIQNLSKLDSRLTCAVLSVIQTGTAEIPAGTITIDFDSLKNCVDSVGVKRSGKIIINYVGKRWAVGSYIIVLPQNFYRNFTQIEGTLSDTIKSVTVIKSDTTQIEFTSDLKDGKITFVDGNSVTRTHSITRIWYKSLLRDHNELHITKGSATGQYKNGLTYQIEIESPLINRFACQRKKVFIPVAGIEVLKVNSSPTYKLDFGAGICDNLVTVTVNGKEKVISVTTDGN
jgi:hypothetical protein